MGRKPASCEALWHLIDRGVEVAAVVAPAPMKDTIGGLRLSDAAADLRLPVVSADRIYDVLAGRSTNADIDLGRIDLVLSFLFWRRIERPLIDLPRIGCFNFHPAPLPGFRGRRGYNFAILEGCTEYGASVHYVADTLDTGDLVSVRTFPVAPDETALSLERKTLRLLVGMFGEFVDGVCAGAPIPRTPQGPGRSATKEEMLAAARIRPDDAEPVVARKVRAYWYPPYEGATVDVQGRRFTLVDREILADVGRLVHGPVGVRREVRIGDRVLGRGGCFLIAEAGVNHNGNLEMARALVDVAAAAGVDAVKFQSFEPELVASADAPTAEYQRRNDGTESQIAMLRRLVLPREAVRSLAQYSAEKGLVFMSTPFDEVSADILDALGVAAFKVPSGEITNFGLLAHIARKGKPVLMSTGMSTLDEVTAAVRTIEANGSPPLALLHCVTDYPAAAAECNLRAMDTMRDAFGVPVGWSDHTNGTAVFLAAVARGAAVAEKHFTLSRRLPGPDHAASLEPDELIALVKTVREIESALGHGVKEPTPSELVIRPVVRRGLHARHDLAAGRTLTGEDLVALRPVAGIPSERLPAVIGRTLRAVVRRGTCLQEDDLE